MHIYTDTAELIVYFIYLSPYYYVSVYGNKTKMINLNVLI